MENEKNTITHLNTKCNILSGPYSIHGAFEAGMVACE